MMDDKNLEKGLNDFFERKKLEPYKDIAKGALKRHRRKRLINKVLIAVLIAILFSIGLYFFLRKKPQNQTKQLVAQVITDHPYQINQNRSEFKLDSIYAGFLLIEEGKYNRAIKFLQQDTEEAKFYLAIAYLGTGQEEKAKSILTKLTLQKAKKLVKNL